MPGGEPEEALGADDGLPKRRVVGVCKIEHPLRTERRLAAIDKGGDAILLRLGSVDTKKLLEPARRGLSDVKIESAGAENGLRLDEAVDGGNDARIPVEPADKGHDGVDLVLGGDVSLVDQDDVGKLDLVDEQVGDGPIVVVVLGHAQADEILAGGEPGQQGRPVHHGHHRIDVHQISNRGQAVVAKLGRVE